MEIGDSLREAIRDYRLLLDRGYPASASLKLVGDRRRLEKRERMVLFRGVLSSENSAEIAGKLLHALPPGAPLAVDGYNVLFTLVNYRRGHPLFVGTDGLLRDAGGAYGRIQREADFVEAGGLLARTLSELGAGPILVYLDSPISGSGKQATSLREASARSGLDCAVELVPSADPFVRDWEGGAVASSDSAVALRSKSPVFDLARRVLEESYGATFPDLGACL